jgi:hypothetical protein
MHIRPAVLDDALDLLCWRNDPLTRQMSRDSRVISESEHLRWYNRALGNPHIEMYVGHMGNEKFGVCRFDLNPSESFSEVSLNVNPTMRGRNLSLGFLSECICLYRKHRSVRLKASINNKNIGSLKVFQGCGFLLTCERDEFSDFCLPVTVA